MFYYLQDKRQFVGNCVMWWKKNAEGYTTDIRKAHIFSADDLKERSLRSTDIPWPKSYIDNLIRHTIDMQTLNAKQAIL